MTYLVRGSIVVKPDRIEITDNVTHLASGLSIYAGMFENPVAAGETMPDVAAAVRDFAVRMAQPYGIISSHVWKTLSARPGWQGTYACQLKVFDYWQTYRRANYDDAFECLARQLAMEPDSPALLANQAFLYVEAARARYVLPDPELSTREKLLDRALKVAGRAVKEAPTSARAHSALAAAYMINRDFAASVTEARAALGFNPRDPELRADLGAKLVQTGAYREARDLLAPVVAMGGAQPQWRVVFAALASYMIFDDAELARFAAMLKTRDGALPQTLLLIDALRRDDKAAVATHQRALDRMIPGGVPSIVGELGQRVYNDEILERVKMDLLPLYAH